MKLIKYFYKTKRLTGVVVSMLDSVIVVNKFELWSFFYFLFLTNNI